MRSLAGVLRRVHTRVGTRERIPPVSLETMRQAVLDVGSNTAHLLVVDAYRGAPPLPASSMKKPLRLAEQLTQGGALSDEGVDALVSFIREALTEAEDRGCEAVMAFATSAIREATNTDGVLELVQRAHRDRARGSRRRGRGAVDVPRGPTVVRVVVWAPGRFRHRGRLARDRRGQ